MKRAKRITFGVVTALLVLMCAAAAFLGMVLHGVSERMHAPQLASEPQVAGDVLYRTLNGQVQRLSDNKGHVVFLNLWGTWCIPCIVEMPKVQRLYDHYQGDPEVRFLIVSRLDSPDTVRLFAKQGRFTLPFYVTHDSDIP